MLYPVSREMAFVSFQGCVAEGKRDQKMWWKTDTPVQRHPIRFVEPMLKQKLVQAKPSRRAQQQKRLKLPISVAQAAANLMLQESGADCTAEVPRLRKDIRLLETAIQDATARRTEATVAHASVQRENLSLRKKIRELVVQLDETKAQAERAQLQALSRRKWAALAADLANEHATRDQNQHVGSQRQISELIASLDEVTLEKCNLENLLERTQQENAIYLDVIDDMESLRGTELQEARRENEVLQRRLSKEGVIDRSHVQQLNIRLVSQAAEIRSLKKEFADSQRIDVSDGNGYQTVFDDQPAVVDDLSDDRFLRLENSLQAVRTELDTAVHQLKYYEAENVRLRSNVERVEHQYDSDFRNVVQVAELHATHAATMEQWQEFCVTQGLTLAAPEGKRKSSEGQQTFDDMIVKDGELPHKTDQTTAIQTTALQTTAIQSSPSIAVEQLKIEMKELRDTNHQLESLQGLQAKLTGENKMLAAFNTDLEQRLSGVHDQLSGLEQKYADDKAQWNALLAHHEGGTKVAQAECRLVKSQFEEQRLQLESKLDQQLEVIQCLNADIVAARACQRELESEIEGEKVNRNLADQEVKRVENEAARIIESLSRECDRLKQKSLHSRDEPGADSSIRSAA